jgi:hypothetical protein
MTYYTSKEVTERLGFSTQSKLSQWLDTFGLSPYFTLASGGMQHRYTEPMVDVLLYVKNRRAEKVRMSVIAEEIKQKFPGVFFPADRQVLIPEQSGSPAPLPVESVTAHPQAGMRILQVTRETAIGITEDVLEDMAGRMLPQLVQPLLTQMAELHLLLKTQGGVQAEQITEALTPRFTGLEQGVLALANHLKGQDDRIAALETLLKTSHETQQNQTVQVQVIQDTLQQASKQVEDTQRGVNRWVQTMAKTWVGRRLGLDRLAGYTAPDETDANRDSASAT